MLGRGQAVLRDLVGIRRTAGNAVLMSYLASFGRALPSVLSARSLIPVDRAMPRRVYSFTPFKGRQSVLLDSREESGPGEVFSGAREMYCRHVYFPDQRFSISSGDVVIDLGANIGLFTTMAAVLGATVYAVEAQSGLLRLIDGNLERNHAAERAEIQLGLIGGSSGVLAGGPAVASHWEIDPPSMSLADIVRDRGIRCIDFLKIDIEGSEFSLFAGDCEWLAITRRIAMEVHPRYGDARAIRETIESFGFDAWITSNDGVRVEQLQESTGYLYALKPLIGSPK